MYVSKGTRGTAQSVYWMLKVGGFYSLKAFQMSSVFGTALMAWFCSIKEKNVSRVSKSSFCLSGQYSVFGVLLGWLQFLALYRAL